MSSILAFEVGDRVLIENGPVDGNALTAGNSERSGTIRYIGKTEFRDGDWLGVELDTPDGKNDGSVAGVRYFTCKPFYGLFVSPNKVRLNLSGSETTPSTPNHIEKIQNYEMDFSSVKEMTETTDKLPVGLKTPTSNVKSQANTPASSDFNYKQNDLTSLKEQISSVRADLEIGSSPSQEATHNIVSKLTSMLDTYEKVAVEYESLLKQSIMAKKAGKLDGNINRLEDEVADLNREKRQLSQDLERLRAELYDTIQSRDHLKQKFESQETALQQINLHLQSEERKRLALEEENQRLKFENTKAKTELDIEQTMEEEQRRRTNEHESQFREMRARFEADLHQKKLQIADLQNEVALLKQTEKILEEELKSRSSRLSSQDETELQRENRKLLEQVSQYRFQADEYRKKYDDVYASKLRAEESYRSELEAFKQLRAETAPRSQYEDQLADETREKLERSRLENEKLSSSLNAANKEIERLSSLSSELESRLGDKERRIVSLSECIQDLEKRVLEDSSAVGKNLNLEHEVKLLSEQLADAQIRLNGPSEQVQNLKRKISIIEREKELLEEQLRNARASALSYGELQTFSGFIQSLKRHIDAEILSLEPMKMTLSDVIRAKEIVDILMKVTEDVRLKVLTHLGQVEDVIKQRQPASRPILSSEISAPETVKIDRSRNYEPIDQDLRRKLDFRVAGQDSSSRYLREPLGVVNTSIFSKNFDSERRVQATAPTASLVSAGLNGSISDYLRPVPSQQQFGPLSGRQNLKVQAPSRCNLCHEYGHDSLSCTDYLSGSESDDAVLNDLRNNLRSNRNSRFYNVATR